MLLSKQRESTKVVAPEEQERQKNLGAVAGPPFSWIISNICHDLTDSGLLCKSKLTQKWNSALQIDILTLRWIATRLHQDTGRFGVAGPCRARERGADRPEKALPMLSPWILENTGNHGPTVRGFQLSPPGREHSWWWEATKHVLDAGQWYLDARQGALDAGQCKLNIAPCLSGRAGLVLGNKYCHNVFFWSQVYKKIHHINIVYINIV